MTFETVTLGRSAAGRAAEVTARALFDDPYSCHFFPDEARRLPALVRVERSILSDVAEHGELRGVVADGELVAVTAWLPPGAHRQGVVRSLRQLLVLLPLAVRHGSALVDALRVLRSEGRAHPEEPHWWLVVVAVHPAVQGTGVGGSLVDALVERCDAEGSPCYLRTTNPANVGWYERFGFDVRDRLHPLGDGPPMWLLWRDPQA